MKKAFLSVVSASTLFFALNAKAATLRDAEDMAPPYSLQKSLERSESLFKENNFRDALVFYYEALNMSASPSVKAKLHFRIGECLESLERYDFASYHFKLAVVSNKLPELLQSRAIMKLESLPDLAQKVEAERLYNRALTLYKQRNLRACISDYLESIRLMPTLMERNDSGLVEDGIKYLTLLSESRDKEPDRLLKLASLLELRGDIEKARDTLQQIVIIYPDSDEAHQAEEKLNSFENTNTTYLEPVRPEDAVAQVMVEELLYEDNFEFIGSSATSRNLGDYSFAFKAYNERAEIPNNRFEIFVISLGSGSEQKEYVYTSSEGIQDKNIIYETDKVLYTLTFKTVEQTVGYIQDLYGDGRQSVNLFSKININLKVEGKAN